jgi:type III pantothenate kinase
VNSIAAYERYKTSLIAIDYGTATTFDCVSEKGEYLGGCIAPGPALSAEALFAGTSMLPRVDISGSTSSPHPDSVLGQDTVSAIQAGIIYGFAGLTEELIRRLCLELPKKPKVVATGGLSSVISRYCPSIAETIPDLTLEGLAIIYKRINGH